MLKTSLKFLRMYFFYVLIIGACSGVAFLFDGPDRAIGAFAAMSFVGFLALLGALIGLVASCEELD